MTFSDLLVVWVRTGAVLTVALVVALFARGHAPLRVAACRWGLAGALGLAIVGPWWASRPAPPVAVPVFPSPVVMPPMERRVALGGGPLPSATRRSREASVADSSVSLDVLAPVWAAGALLLAGHLLLGFVLLAGVRRGCRPVRNEALTRRLALLAQEAGIRTPLLVEGSRVRGPFVAGAFRATVFLPLGFAVRTDAEAVEAVLRHEVAHVANGDLRWGLFGRVARIALWPQPLVWILRGLQAAAEERACDRQVVLSGVPAAGYAAGLLALREGRDGGRTPGLGIGAAARRSGFGRRIEAILSASGAGGARLSRLGAWAVVGGAAILAGGSAWAFARALPPAATVPGAQKMLVKGPYAGSVKVLDEAGKPIQGARAWLTVIQKLSPPPKELRVEGSRIALPKTQAGAGSTGMLAVRAPGYALFPVKLWPAPKRVTEVRLPRPSALAGRFVLSDGRPATGVMVSSDVIVTKRGDFVKGVTLDTGGETVLTLRAVTDAAGRFRLEGLPPESRVSLNMVDVAYARFPHDAHGMTGAPGSVAEVDAIRLWAAARITGRVTQNGRPVGGVIITAYRQNESMRKAELGFGFAVSHKDGRYIMSDLAPSTVNVSADINGSLGAAVTARAHEGVRVAEGATVWDVDFELVPGTIVEGTVTLPDGKPLAGTEVGIYGPAHPESSPWVGRATTDARGRYRARVPAGAQRVYLMDSRYESEQKRVTTTADAPTRVDFRAKAKAETREALAEFAAEDAVPQEPVEDALTEPTAAFGPGKPFYGPVRLKRGGTARLAFVQDGDVSGSVWSPDGSTPSAADRARALDRGTGDMRDPNGKSRRLLLRVDVTGTPGSEFEATVQVPHPSSWNVWQSYGGRNGQAIDLATFRANANLRRTDMRVGIGYGPWRTLSSGRIGEGPLAARVGSKSPNRVTIRFPNAAVFQNSRLVAFGPDGKALSLRMNTWPKFNRRTGVREASYEFEGSPIARVELQVRDWEWVTFRGIALYPNASSGG